ncbi:MAG: hypothetical protein ABW352_18425 [Polyangiales bacterium]
MKRVFLLLLVACGDTGQEHVDLPLTASGTAPRTVMSGMATVTLTRADVAFGPLYVCASESGRAELCSVAAGEFLGTVAVRALDPAPQPLGELNATTNTIRSGLFDYGISWLLTETQSRPNPGAIEGHSAILEGTLTRGAQSARFRVTLDAEPRMAGDLAVNGQVTRFALDGPDHALNIGFDPHYWVDNLDADALFALEAGSDGVVTIPADSVLHESVLQGMVSRFPASFQWR